MDVIQTFGHADGDRLLESFRERQPALKAALADARSSIPVIYANDPGGVWDGDAPALVRRAIEERPGRELVAEVAPRSEELFIAKPRSHTSSASRVCSSSAAHSRQSLKAAAGP